MTEQLKVYEEAYTKDLNLVKTLSIVEQHELSEYQKKVSNYRITSRFQSRNKKIGSGTASLSGNNKNNHISGKF